jgi:hypothetical protein
MTDKFIKGAKESFEEADAEKQRMLDKVYAPTIGK